MIDRPLIFVDPLALTILGATQQAALREDPGRYVNPVSNVMRATMAVRSRVAEDGWWEAQRQGVRQYVILGAGLDTSAYRTDAAPDTCFYEVDLPSTQQWKRACLSAAGIAEPTCLHYVAIDFVETSLEQGLRAAGFQSDLPATFSWLGVSMYLPAEVVLQTLRQVASGALASSIVFDYLIDPALLAPIERSGLEMMAAHLKQQGEPLQSHFEPAALEDMLRQFGFRHIDHLRPDVLHARYLAGRSDGLRLSNVFSMIRAFV